MTQQQYHGHAVAWIEGYWPGRMGLSDSQKLERAVEHDSRLASEEAELRRLLDIVVKDRAEIAQRFKQP